MKTKIPALDGLRGIAVLWVMLHNGSFFAVLDFDTVLGGNLWRLLHAGWLGVQLFFVLSGFLITGILLDAKEHKSGNIFKNFYMRRVLRIFPVYYVTLIAIALFAYFQAGVSVWADSIADHMTWFALYMNNWLHPFVHFKLGHFWSLAVEEQFYLLWPFVVIFVSRQSLLKICLLLIAFAMAFRFGMALIDPQFAVADEGAYLWTPCRIDALAVGALLAIVIREYPSHQNLGRIVNLATIASILYCMTAVYLKWSFNSVEADWTMLNQTVAAILFGACIYHCITPAGIGKVRDLFVRAVSFSWLRTCGKYSYAMYIFHAPMALLLKEKVYPGINVHVGGGNFFGVPYFFVVDTILFVACTFGLAIVSWMLIEKPFLDAKKKWEL